MPVAGGDEAGPVKRVRGLPRGAALAQCVQIGLTDRINGGEPKHQARTIQLAHPIARRLVFDRPKAQDQRACSRHFKRAAQTQHALAGLHFTDAGIASREHGPLDTAQIERGDFLGGENSVNWNKSNDHFYDVETGLLAAYEFESDAGGTPAHMHEIFSDYRSLDGVLIPMKQVVKIKPKGANDFNVFLTLTYTHVTFNDVDPTVFAPPQAVRDLAAKGKPVPGS
jgi:hypothetical protein